MESIFEECFPFLKYVKILVYKPNGKGDLMKKGSINFYLSIKRKIKKERIIR